MSEAGWEVRVKVFEWPAPNDAKAGRRRLHEAGVAAGESGHSAETAATAAPQPGAVQ